MADQQIIILTFDGTASLGGSFVGDLNKDEGGSYPAKLAKRLVDADPLTWVWCPVDYHPEYVLFGDPGTGGQAPVKFAIIDGKPMATMQSNFTRATTIATNYINAYPNAKIVLSGLSQGTFPVSLMYEELLNPAGALYARRNDLLSVVNFGDACRPPGKTIPLAGATNPGGQGAMTYPMLQSYGWRSAGHIQRYSAFGSLYDNHYWAFCNLNDAASAVSADAAGVKLAKICRALIYGSPGTSAVTNTVYSSTFRLFDGPLADLANWIPGDLDNLLLNLLGMMLGGCTPASLWGYVGHLFKSESLVGWVDNTKQLLQIVSLWFPFVTGAIAPSLVPNPHAMYNDPNPYTAMTGNTKSAVQLAFEYLYALGLTYNQGAQWTTTLRV